MAPLVKESRNGSTAPGFSALTARFLLGEEGGHSLLPGRVGMCWVHDVQWCRSESWIQHCHMVISTSFYYLIMWSSRFWMWKLGLAARWVFARSGSAGSMFWKIDALPAPWNFTPAEATRKVDGFRVAPSVNATVRQVHLCRCCWCPATPPWPPAVVDVCCDAMMRWPRWCRWPWQGQDLLVLGSVLRWHMWSWEQELPKGMP